MIRRAENQSDEEMLATAVAKARALVAELQRQQAELEAKPGTMSPDQIAEGRRVFDNAVAAATETLRALETAASTDRAD